MTSNRPLNALQRRMCAGGLALLLAACGGGGSGGPGPGGGTGGGGAGNAAPVISNLNLSSYWAGFNEGDGVKPVTVSLDYLDADADITAIRVEVTNGLSATLDVAEPLPGSTGILFGDIEIPTTESGDFLATVWAIDGMGNESNRLSTSFEVRGSSLLSDLALTGVPFDRPFDPLRLDGNNAAVEPETGQVYVTATLEDSNSSFDIDGTPAMSGVEFGPIDLEFGANSIFVNSVTAKGTGLRSYRISVFRQTSSNARLKSLRVIPGTLDAAFSPDVSENTATLSLLARHVSVLLETENEYATVRINNEPSQSGVPGPPVPVFLEGPDTTFNISVTAQDGITRETYWLSMKRRKPAPFALFEIIADDTTLWPGTADTFIHVDTPSYDGNRVTFYGASANNGGIIATTGGNLEIVADRNTPEPRNGVETFDIFRDPSVEGNGIAFHSTAPGFAGLYTSIDGILSVVADNQTPIPGGTGTFSGLSEPSFNSGSTAFAGFGPNVQRGIYSTASGSLDVVVDKTTVAPNSGGALFQEFGAPVHDSSGIAFQGNTTIGGQEGIYKVTSGALEMIADRTTLVPGVGSTLEFFDDSIGKDGDRVAFSARDTSFTLRLFVHDGTNLQTAVDDGAAIPMRSTAFNGPGTPVALDGTTLVVQGISGPVLLKDGSMVSIAGAGDIVGGRTIEAAFLRNNALAGDKIALRLRHTDASGSVVLADFGLEKPVATASYELDGNFSDSEGGADISAAGGMLQGRGYAFGQNQGLTLAGVLGTNEYSIELVFRLDDIAGRAKLIDFAELASDSGLYLEAGELTFFDSVTPGTAAASGTLLENAVNYHLVLTRSGATGEVTLWIDGEERLNFADAAGQATFATSLATFFRDDDVTQDEAAAGFVHFVRSYDSALSAQQVRYLARALSDCALDGCLQR